MDIKEPWGEIVDWIHTAQVRDQWRVLVNAVMDVLFP